MIPSQERGQKKLKSDIRKQSSLPLSNREAFTNTDQSLKQTKQESRPHKQKELELYPQNKDFFTESSKRFFFYFQNSQ